MTKMFLHYQSQRLHTAVLPLSNRNDCARIVPDDNEMITTTKIKRQQMINNNNKRDNNVNDIRKIKTTTEEPEPSAIRATSHNQRLLAFCGDGHESMTNSIIIAHRHHQRHLFNVIIVTSSTSSFLSFKYQKITKNHR